MRNDRFDDGRRRYADDVRVPGERHEHELRSERDVTSRLVHLDDVTDFKVADGDPDVRGWDVRAADGRKIGRVEDLIVDTRQMKVRYLEAKLDKAVTRSDRDRYVLIPIGTARLDQTEDDVYLGSNIVDPQQLPEYDRSELTRDYEVSLRGQFATGNADAVNTNDDFYQDDLYDESRFFGRRRRGRGSSTYIDRRVD